MGSEEQERFLENLKALCVREVTYQWENLSLASSPSAPTDLPHLIDYFTNIMRGRENYGEVLQRIDLDGGVKHYQHSDLGRFTHDAEQNSVIGKTVYGKIMAGKIEEVDVVIKTWDVIKFPTTPTVYKHPRRLHNEIMLLTKEPLKSNPSLPKLIGYSIDKTLAVVYGLKTQGTLRSALLQGNLDWNTRLSVAVQVAHLLKNLHGKNIIIGSIDPQNILIDEEGYIKLIAFGLRAGMQGEVVNYEDLCSWWTAAIYNRDTPELGKPQGNWRSEIDIFAFGNLLVELVLKEAVDPHCDCRVKGLTLSNWFCDMLQSGKINNFLYAFLVDDADIRSRIADIVINCLSKTPWKRWKADVIAKQLEDLKQGSPSKKPKVDDTC